MDIELIRTFVEVNKARHFGHAAGRLFITQAAVSARVRQLENLLGGRLFDRDPKQVRLTSFGARFLPHAEQLLSVWNQARNALRDTPPPTARYTLGAPPALLETVVADWLSRQPADLVFELCGGEPDVLVQSLTEGRIDGVFSCGPERPAGVERHAIGSLSLVQVRARGRAPRRIAVRCGRECLAAGDSNGDIEVPSFTAALALLKMHGGECWLPKSWSDGLEVTASERRLEIALLGGLRIAGLFAASAE